MNTYFLQIGFPFFVNRNHFLHTEIVYFIYHFVFSVNHVCFSRKPNVGIHTIDAGLQLIEKTRPSCSKVGSDLPPLNANDTKRSSNRKTKRSESEKLVDALGVQS